MTASPKKINANITEAMREVAFRSVREYLNQGPILEALDMQEKKIMVTLINCLNLCDTQNGLKFVLSELRTIDPLDDEADDISEDSNAPNIIRTETEFVFESVKSIWEQSITRQVMSAVASKQSPTM